MWAKPNTFPSFLYVFLNIKHMLRNIWHVSVSSVLFQPWTAHSDDTFECHHFLITGCLTGILTRVCVCCFLLLFFILLGLIKCCLCLNTHCLLLSTPAGRGRAAGQRGSKGRDQWCVWTGSDLSGKVWPQQMGLNVDFYSFCQQNIRWEFTAERFITFW